MALKKQSVLDRLAVFEARREHLKSIVDNEEEFENKMVVEMAETELKLIEDEIEAITNSDDGSDEAYEQSIS